MCREVIILRRIEQLIPKRYRVHAGNKRYGVASPELAHKLETHIGETIEVELLQHWRIVKIYGGESDKSGKARTSPQSTPLNSLKSSPRLFCLGAYSWYSSVNTDILLPYLPVIARALQAYIRERFGISAEDVIRASNALLDVERLRKANDSKDKTQ